jgi:hypothetical protein
MNINNVASIAGIQIYGESETRIARPTGERRIVARVTIRRSESVLACRNFRPERDTAPPQQRPVLVGQFEFVEWPVSIPCGIRRSWLRDDTRATDVRREEAQ